MNKYLRLTEKAFVVLGLTSFPGILYVLSQVNILPQNIITLIKYGVWTASVILACIFCKSIIFKANRNIILYILIALVLLSCTWSEFPDFSLSIAFEVLIMSLFGLYFGTRFSLKEQVELVACTLFIGAILSTIFALVFPAVGVDHELHPGAWKGVYGQKNALGNMMVLSSLAFFILPNKNSTIYKWFGFTFSLVLMLLSTSKTSLVISFLLILIMALYKKFRWQGKVSVIFINIGILIVTCLALLVCTYWIELLSGLGKDPTLTGRIPLWGYALAKLMERPLLGYGLSAFWAPNSQYAINAGLTVQTGWIAPNAHNGLLDLSLDVGLIGVSLFLITYFTTFARALKRAYATKNSEELWPLAYLTFLAMNNVTESRFLGQFSVPWILYITIVLTLNQKKQIETKRNIRKKIFLHVI